MPLSDEQKEGARFLDRDFTQCFQQIRHYDGQIVDICKFAFTGYIAVVGVALTLYKYGADKNLDFTLPVAAVLCVAALFGFLLFGLVVRNRVYFTLVARYVNEHRRFFLRQKPLGFANATQMYSNPEHPPYFTWFSSHAWMMYLLALLNAVMLAIASSVVCFSKGYIIGFCLIPSGAALVTQLVAAIAYLSKRERKSASHALWGKE